MVDAILLDQKRVLPCSVYLQGEYGYRNIFLGVPVKLGAAGVEQVVEIELSDQEKHALEHSASSVRDLLKVMQLPTGATSG
jgi:malate dehydrogenase